MLPEIVSTVAPLTRSSFLFLSKVRVVVAVPGALDSVGLGVRDEVCGVFVTRDADVAVEGARKAEGLKVVVGVVVVVKTDLLTKRGHRTSFELSKHEPRSVLRQVARPNISEVEMHGGQVSFVRSHTSPPFRKHMVTVAHNPSWPCTRPIIMTRHAQ